eukprot:CAMPEP_0195567838 /NCGR_PEP_ID=MMETSP0814-20130614/1879_1 /TAXON_ID=97485 /ORGANISM="Prymnesium parvum, Strain Texoma1" /LENGTH=98 /DNA_ID=CAMNT_0040703065 /DNA_START=388 /DNA_END=680 /DNA_ORIENTATION=-
MHNVEVTTDGTWTTDGGWTTSDRATTTGLSSTSSDNRCPAGSGGATSRAMLHAQAGTMKQRATQGMEHMPPTYMAVHADWPITMMSMRNRRAAPLTPT